MRRFGQWRFCPKRDDALKRITGLCFANKREIRKFSFLFSAFMDKWEKNNYSLESACFRGAFQRFAIG